MDHYGVAPHGFLRVLELSAVVKNRPNLLKLLASLGPLTAVTGVRIPYGTPLIFQDNFSFQPAARQAYSLYGIGYPRISALGSDAM
jgi:hypothetical protein